MTIRRVTLMHLSIWLVGGTAASLFCPQAALPADFSVMPATPEFAVDGPNVTRWEVRGGLLGSTWGPERGDIYGNGEIIAPKVFRLPGMYDFLVPRLRAGVMGNISGGTNYVDAGVMWTANYHRYFADFFLGGAIHDGQINGHYTDPSLNKLGCRELYHVGWSLGYQLTDHWNVQATFDHVSNGAGTLSNCHENQGISAAGLRLGYSF